MKRMVQEVYKITLTHYIQDEEGEKCELEEPIVCQHIWDRTFCGHEIILNKMFDSMKAYVLERDKHE